MITKEVFLKAYNKFPPNEFVKFIFKYFSMGTKPEDKWVRNDLTKILLLLFICGFLGAGFDSKKFTLIITIIFSSILFILGLSTLTAFFMNNYRIGKIRKELGNISKEDYNDLVSKYESI